MSSVSKIVKKIRTTNYMDKYKNERGSTVHRMLSPSERYVIDFADDFGSEGWMQYDTDQDAPYFGVWVNPLKFMTLTYAEGDWTLIEATGTKGYNEEIDIMNEFYGEGKIATAIDPETGEVTTYHQDRQDFYA